jgi:hypothetical protein
LRAISFGHIPCFVVGNSQPLGVEQACVASFDERTIRYTDIRSADGHERRVVATGLCVRLSPRGPSGFMLLPKSSFAALLNCAPCKAAKHGNDANRHRHEEAKPSVLHEPKRTVNLEAAASDHHLDSERNHRPDCER